MDDDDFEQRLFDFDPRSSKLKAAFDVFDAANPHIWILFIQFAFEAINQGKKKLSVSLIVERIRWEVFVTTDSTDPFKINNNHKAYYARKWIETYPLYATFFNIRRLGWDDHWTPP